MPEWIDEIINGGPSEKFVGRSTEWIRDLYEARHGEDVEKSASIRFMGMDSSGPLQPVEGDQATREQQARLIHERVVREHLAGSGVRSKNFLSAAEQALRNTAGGLEKVGGAFLRWDLGADAVKPLSQEPGRFSTNPSLKERMETEDPDTFAKMRADSSTFWGGLAETAGALAVDLPKFFLTGGIGKLPIVGRMLQFGIVGASSAPEGRRTKAFEHGVIFGGALTVFGAMGNAALKIPAARRVFSARIAAGESLRGLKGPLIAKQAASSMTSFQLAAMAANIEGFMDGEPLTNPKMIAENMILWLGFEAAGMVRIARAKSGKPESVSLTEEAKAEFVPDGLPGKETTEGVAKETKPTKAVDTPITPTDGVGVGKVEQPQGPVSAPKPVAAPTTEPATKVDKRTSIKNRVVNAERIARGDPKMEEELRRLDSEVLERANAEIEKNPSRPEELARDLAENPRPHSDVEVAILIKRRVDLKLAARKASKDGDAANKAGDAEGIADAVIRTNEIHDSLLELDRATKGSGRETARALRLRRAMVADDFSLLDMEFQRRTRNDFRHLTKDQAAETKRLSEALLASEKRLREYEERVAEADAELAAIRAVAPGVSPPKGNTAEPGSKGYGSKNRVFTRSGLDAARAVLKSGRSRLSAGVDPAQYAAMLKVGGYHVEAGLRSFASWAKKVTAELGDGVKPYLERIWRDSNKALAPTHRTEAVEKIKKAIEGGKSIDGMSKYARDLALSFVAEGVNERGKLVDAVHGVLKDIDPKITRLESADLISGYGKITPLTEDAIKLRLKELQGQLLQESKLADMAGGRAPKLTGRVRPVPGDVQRELIRRVNESKREGGYDVRDPKTQAKSILDGIKTRLRNEITDLDKQIETGKREDTKKTVVQYDKEAKDLRDRRDAKREEFDAIFGRPGLSDAQRIARAEGAKERSVVELERRIKERDLFPNRKKALKPKSKKLDTLNARLDALRAELEQMRLVERPPKTREEVILQSMKARLLRERATMLKQLETGDFSKKKTKPVKPDAELVEIKAENETLRAEWLGALIKDELANRSFVKKLLGGVVESANTVRSVWTSMDISAILRQGAFDAISHPIQTARDLPKYALAMKSKGAQAKIEADLKLNPLYGTAERAGLFLAEHGTTERAKMEEVFQSRTAEKIPGVAASQRGYTTYLNVRRMGRFSALAATLTRSGRPTDAQAKVLANFVNVSFGRGAAGPKVANLLQGLAGGLFAPRLGLSRFQYPLLQPLLTHIGGYRGTLKARSLILSEYVRFGIGISLIYGIAKQMGATVESDPRSSDFGKIRVGSVRVDLLGGMSQTIVFTNKVLRGQSMGLDTQEIRSLRSTEKKFGQSDTTTTIGRFLRSKAAPVPGMVIDALSGTDYIGKPVTAGSLALDLFKPLVVDDVIESYTKQGFEKGTILSVLALLGAGVANFEKRVKKTKKRRKNKRKRTSLRDRMRR